MRLKEIDILRVICILLVVADHSFALFSGHWKNSYGLPDIRAYFWIGRFASCFMLPLFVFISGYVFSWQINVVQKKYSFWILFKKKASRLLIPCYSFGFLYILLFSSFNDWINIKGILLFFSGVEHLWFLPMLFWCFLFALLLIRAQYNSYMVLTVLAFVNIFTIETSSFGLLHALYYLFYFYLGYIIFQNKEEVVTKIMPKLPYLIVCFLILFPICTKYISCFELIETSSLCNRFLLQWQIHCFRFLPAFLGVLISYLIALKINNEPYSKLVNCSMGIYLLHYFIIICLLSQLSVTAYVGVYALPFLLMFVSYFGSLLLTELLIRTKLGKSIL